MLRPAAVRSPLGYGGMPRRRARLVGRVCNEPYTKLFTEPSDVLLEPSDAFYRTVRTELFTEPWEPHS
jgi:hypothetical protein